ncbi:IPP transferase-domain-containing protein [Elsinoe ampelina]|uniref:tRNA dimethylallyltransferase n=1 Tax=Elsinoe ampelina TaxID=302913 RepID=A0A6A6GJE6_9PEZI|nr:IPP transferase-domain-containing protein [Elsinoe ampelina]
MAPKPKIIAVVGATGTGKSELAVALATRFNGEVLNADAMQLYAGLDIITNKIPLAERNGVPHHLLGCIGIDEQPWTVGKFCSSALKTIEDIRSRGKLPILVGGTHYYTQSLLFHDRLTGESQAKETDSAQAEVDLDTDVSTTGSYEDVKTKFSILEASTEEILSRLKEVDPVMASRWHPNDRRKIQRSLEIWLQTGRRASDIYAEQKNKQGAPTNGHSSETHTQKDNTESKSRPEDLRMDTIIFWVHADTNALYKRLNNRVDKMVTSGLLAEVQGLSKYAIQNPTLDKTSGIWVSIGYKEFLPYLDRSNEVEDGSHIANLALSSESKELNKLLREAIEATKAGTRQYAKRQVSWIRIKLLNALQSSQNAGQGKMYLLDGTNMDDFQNGVIDQAKAIAERWLGDESLPDPSSISSAAAELLKPKRNDLSNSVGKWERQVCEACNVVGVTPSDWDLHVKSRRHRRNVANLKKQPGGRECSVGAE